jgi:hypothetical protein
MGVVDALANATGLSGSVGRHLNAPADFPVARAVHRPPYPRKEKSGLERSKDEVAKRRLKVYG